MKFLSKSLSFSLPLIITCGLFFAGDSFAQSYVGADSLKYRGVVNFLSPNNKPNLPALMKFYEALNSAGSEYIGWRAPFNMAASYTLIFPGVAPTAGQILQAANSDSIIWGNAGAGDVTGVIAGVGLADGGLSGDVTLNVIYAATAGNADTLTLHDFVTGTPSTNTFIKWNGANWVTAAAGGTIIGREVDGSPSIAALSTLEFLQSTGLKFTDQTGDVGRVEIDTSTVWINTKTEIAAQIASAIAQKQDDSDTTGFDASKTWVLAKSYLVAADISAKQDDTDTTGFDASKTWVLSKSYLVAADIAAKQDDADTLTWDATKTYVNSRGFLTTETGDISAVTAGYGLAGGGTTGAVTLTVDSTTVYLQTKTENNALYVPLSRMLTAGNGLVGGGDLAANRTFDVIGSDGLKADTDTLRAVLTSTAGLLIKAGVGAIDSLEMKLDGSTLSKSTAGVKVSAIGSTEITNGAILNEDINASAAIALSKIASSNAGRLVITSGGTVAERAALTASALVVGDATNGVASLALGTANRVVGMNSGATANEYKDILGTSNRVTVTHGANSITLNAPQDLHTAALNQFSRTLLDSLRFTNTGGIWQNSDTLRFLRKSDGLFQFKLDLGDTPATGEFMRVAAGRIVNFGAIADADVPNTITLDNVTQITTRALSDMQGQVTDTQIADGAVDGGTGGEIADNTLTADDIATDAIGALELAANAADSGNVIQLGISAGDINDAAILNAKLATAAVDSNKIKDSHVTTLDIKDANVNTADLASSAVTSVKLAAGAVDSSKITDGSIAATDLVNLSVLNGKIAASAVDSTKIKASHVTSTDIKDGEILTADLASQSVTGAKIKLAVIDSTHITDGAIAATDIKDAEILNAKIAASAVDSTKIKTGAVTTTDILDATINTGDLANSAVTGAKILDNTVNANDVDETVTYNFSNVGNIFIGTKAVLDSLRFAGVNRISANNDTLYFYRKSDGAFQFKLWLGDVPATDEILKIGAGRIASWQADAVSGGAGGYSTIQEEGSGLTQRATINFVGSSATAADDAGNTRTNVTFDADLNALASNSTDGFWTHTGAGTGAARTMTGTGGAVSITNGDGISGNPTFTLPSAITVPTSYAIGSDPADAEVIRLENNAKLAWEAAPAGVDYTLGVDASEILQASGTFNAVTLTENGNAITSDGDALGGDLSGNLPNPSVTDDSHAHTTTTISGLDVSSDLNLVAGTNITLIGDQLDVDDAFVLNTGDAIAGNLDFNDGSTDSPQAIFTPATGTAWKFYTVDSDDDLTIESASSGSTENIDITNPGAGTATLTVEGAISASNLSGANTGDQTITLTSHVTGSGTGSFATTIANSVITAAMIANGDHGAFTYASNVAALDAGSVSGGNAGTVTDNTITADDVAADAIGASELLESADFAITGSMTFDTDALHIFDTNASHDLIITPGSDLTADHTLTLTTGDADRTLTISGNTTLSGGSHSGTNTGDQTITLTGDVTGAGTGSFAATIANDAVTLAKMANIVTASVIGRNTAGTGDPEVLTTLPNGVQDNITRLGTIASGVWNGTDIAVADGGTGAATFTANGVLYGNTTSALQVTAQGGANTVLTANAGAPSFSGQPTLATGIITKGQNAIEIDPYGASAGNTGEVRFVELAANGTNYGGWRGQDAYASSVVYRVPRKEGASTGYVLHYASTGDSTYWDTDDGAGGGAPTDAQYLTLALNGSLSAERVAVGATNNISTNDGGANGNFTIGLAATLDLAAKVVINDTLFVAEGASANTFETHFTIDDPTADQEINFPDLSGEVTLLGNTTSGTGAILREGSPTITTPTIGDFSNSQHSHANAAGGGVLSSYLFLAPTAGQTFTSDGTSETLIFDFQAAFTTGNQYTIKQTTGNPTGGSLFALQAADANVSPIAKIENTAAVTIPIGLQIAATNGSGVLLTALDLSDTEIDTALVIGANLVRVNGAVLAYTELARLDGKDAALVDANDTNVIVAAHMANGDHGAFTYASNVASLDASSVSGGTAGIITDNTIIADDIAADAVGSSELLESADFSITGSVTFDSDALHIFDTNASHDLIITPGSDLTVDRVLTITTGDAARTLTMTADASIAGTNTGDVSLAGTPDYITISGQTITRAKLDIVDDLNTFSSANLATNLTDESGAAGVFPRFSLTGAAQGDVIYYNGTSWVNLGPGTAGQVLESGGAAANPAWGTDDNSGGATAWDAITDPSADGSVAFGGTTQVIDGNTNDVTAIAQDLLQLNYTNDGATDVLTQRILTLNKLAASTNALERGLVIDNQDGAALDVGIEIVGTSTGAVTTALKLDDAEIGTWANIGANDLVTAATTLASTELDRLDGKDAALIDLNDSPVATGAWDLGGATSFEIPNGANPTVSVAGQISVDSEGTTESAVRFFADAEYVLPARFSKAFVIFAPSANDDIPLWRVPYGITIRAIHVLVVGGTNVIGGLDEADGNGASSAAIDADITGSAGTNANDDGTLSNGTLDAGDYLMWHTTSVSGSVTNVTITFEYTVDPVN